MGLLTVGSLYSDRTQWEEGADYNFRADTHELRLFYQRPSAAEVSDIESGRAAFALATYRDVIIICYRFGEQPWSDATYTWHLVPEDERTIPDFPASDEERALLHIVLIDATTGIVKALRACTYSPAFTAALHDAIRYQSAQPFNREEYDRQSQRVYAGHTSRQIATQLARYRCVGGE